MAENKIARTGLTGLTCLYRKNVSMRINGYISFPVVLVFLLLNAFVTPSVVFCKSFQSAIRSDTFNLDGALQRVAIKFFPPEQEGIPYFVKMEKRIELHSQGIEYEIYSVQKNYIPIGYFVRYKVFSDDSSRADLALLVNEGMIEKVEPLRISALEGKPFLQSAAMFDSLSGCEVSRYSGPLSKFFKSLIYVEEISKNTKVSGPKMTDEQGTAFSKALFDSLPKPSGDCPDFVFTTIDGKKITRDQLKGKGLLLVWGTFMDFDSREMCKVVSDYAGQMAGKAEVVFVFFDHTEEMNAFVERGGVIPDNSVLDWSEEYKGVFSIPVVPYLVGYSSMGKLLLSSLYYGKEKTIVKLQQFSREVFK